MSSREYQSLAFLPGTIVDPVVTCCVKAILTDGTAVNPAQRYYIAKPTSVCVFLLLLKLGGESLGMATSAFGEQTNAGFLLKPSFLYRTIWPMMKPTALVLVTGQTFLQYLQGLLFPGCDLLSLKLDTKVG